MHQKTSFFIKKYWLLRFFPCSPFERSSTMTSADCFLLSTSTFILLSNIPAGSSVCPFRSSEEFSFRQTKDHSLHNKDPRTILESGTHTADLRHLPSGWPCAACSAPGRSHRPCRLPTGCSLARASHTP